MEILRKENLELDKNGKAMSEELNYRERIMTQERKELEKYK
jgi:hypothetical protein